MVHGDLWTLKELFVTPNEYIYWSVQIVMYPFMTGLVAGAFVLSSLYHVFGIKQLKDIARFALVFSFALLPAAPLPIMLHLQWPLRGINVMMTPHFTSAIAAFGIVFSTYGAIVASELWFLYRKHFVEQSQYLKKRPDKTISEKLFYLIYTVLTLGVYDISEEAQHRDEKAIKILAAIGIPVACFLHGYAGFIFGSVKARLAQIACELGAARTLAYKIADAQMKHDMAGFAASAVKIFSGELGASITSLDCDILGLYGQVELSKWSYFEGFFQKWYQQSFILFIAMGTNEIQRNIISWYGLGLPRMK